MKTTLTKILLTSMLVSAAMSSILFSMDEVKSKVPLKRIPSMMAGPKMVKLLTKNSDDTNVIDKGGTRLC